MESTSETPDPLTAALDDYFKRMARDGTVDREQFLAEYPAIAEQLREYLETADRLEQFATVDWRPPASSDSGRDSDSDSGRGVVKVLRYFGDYDVLDEIGRGGMGVVYRARQRSLNRIVAVKMILAGQLASASDVERFCHEARSAAGLKHSGIVAIHEVGQHEGQHFFSMDYVAGSNLSAIARDHPLPAKKAAEYLATMADAVAYAHNAGILHRDLKSSNILIDAESDQPRITDFGLAKRMGEASGLTASGEVLGTPSYMPPEQAAGKTRDLGPTADVYSLGAILYELLTGRPPFVGQTPWDTLWLVEHRDVVAPSLLTKVPRDLETICLKCLEKDPSRRYRTVADLGADLGRFLRGEPVLARPVSRAERLWRWCLRNPVTSGGIATIALMLIALATVSIFFGIHQKQSALSLKSALGESDRHLHESQANFQQSRYRLAENELVRGLHLCDRGEAAHGMLWLARSLTSAPSDAVELRRAIRENLAGWGQDLCILKAVLKGHLPLAAYSPDGNRFATFGKANQLWDASTGSLLGDPLSSKTDFRDFVAINAGQGRDLWGRTLDSPMRLPDGSYVRLIYVEKGIQVVGADDRKPIGMVIRHEKNEKCPAIISPNGKIVLTCPNKTQAQLWEIASGRPLGRPMEHPANVRAAAFSPDGARLVTGWGESHVERKKTVTVGRAQMWNAASGEAIGMPFMLEKGGYDGVAGVCFSRDGQIVLTVCPYGEMRAWNVATSEPIGPACDHLFPLDQVALVPDGRTALRMTYRGGQLSSLSSGRSIGQFLGNLQSGSVACSPNGRSFLTSDSDGGLRLWGVPSDRTFAPPQHHSEDYTRMFLIAASPDGRKFASAAYGDSTVRIWDALTGKPAGTTFNAFRNGVVSLAWSPDGSILAAGAGQNYGGSEQRRGYRSTLLWDAATGKPLDHQPMQHTNWITSIKFSSDGCRLLTASGDCTALQCDVATGQLIGEPMRHETSIVRASFSPDGKQILTAGYDKTGDGGQSDVRIWNRLTGRLLYPPIPHPQGVLVALFSPDGQTIATVNEGDSIRLWNAATGEPKAIQLACRAEVCDAVFSPDGRWLLTGYRGHSAQLWEVATGRIAGNPLESDGEATQIGFSADGGTILIAGSEGIQRWSAVCGVPLGPKLAAGYRFVLTSDDRKLVASFSQELQFWKLPPLIEGSDERLRTWVEVVTGMTLDSNNTLQILDPDQWQGRKHRLDLLEKGPPIP